MKLLAQINNPVLPESLGTVGKATGEKAVGNLIASIVGAFFIIGFVMALIYLILGAIEWVNSGGEKAGLENARNKITHAIVGLIIIASSWAIMFLVGQFVGFTFTKDTFKLPIPSVIPQTSQSSTDTLQLMENFSKKMKGQ